MEKFLRIVGAALCFALVAGTATAIDLGVPEIDPGQLPALISLVAGGLLVLKSRGRK